MLILGLVSCQMAGIVGEEEIETPKKIESFEDIPYFSELMLHVIQREYALKQANSVLHQNSLNKASSMDFEERTPAYDEYLEDRLMQVYPDIAYDGVVEDIRTFSDSMMSIYNLEEGSDNDLYEEEYEPMTTAEKEIEYLNMTQDEIDLFYSLEQYVDPDDPITSDKIIVIGGPMLFKTADWLGFSQREWMVILVFNGYSAFRIIQCSRRAADKAEAYYPGETGTGRIGDAYRHVYWNVLLRRYLSRPGAYTITTGLEIFPLTKNDNYRDTYMDLHNNYVGRVAKFRQFRGPACENIYDWEGWAENVFNYIDSSSNAAFMDWSEEIDKDIIDEEGMIVHQNKYIIYKR